MGDALRALAGPAQLLAPELLKRAILSPNPILARSSRSPLRSQLRRRNVLLVEDNTTVRQAAPPILSEFGYELLEAPNGAEALSVAHAHRGVIHLLLAGLVMPGMNRRELGRELRKARLEVGEQICRWKARTIMTTMEAPVLSAPQIEGGHFLNLLIVDDEPAIRGACKEIAQSLGFNVFTAEFAKHAYRVLESQGIDAVILDLRLPGAGGLEALNQIKSRRPDAIVVVVTGYGTVESAVQAMKNGAYDYVTKPFSLDELKLLLDRLANHLKLRAENRMLREKIRPKQGFGSIVGRSPEMEKLYRIIAKAAHSTHPVLILGESGTGKELVARSIHFSGPLRDKPFIPVDCGSLVPTLLDSELFGCVKGAFTGALRTRDGLLALAEGGTVFLDEVGELPMDIQAKLLRAIQDKEIRPVGGTKRIPINVRILAATNRDLEQAVARETFRRDLYFRLNVLSLHVPSLRDRRQDIPLLATHFLDRLSRDSFQERTLADEALKAMLAYDWPGNVGELENCLERAYALTTGPKIQLEDLPHAIRKVRSEDGGGPACNGNGDSKIVPMAELEKQAILTTIAQLNGDKLLAARLLGIGKTTLYRKLKEYSSQD